MTAGDKHCRTAVQGRVLVAAFDHSNPPVVWRFDMDKNHSFALAIQGKEGDWHLGVWNPRGEFSSVARFEQRGDVDYALQKLRDTLLANGVSLWQEVTHAVVVTIAVLSCLIFGLLLFMRMVGGSTTPPQAMLQSSAPAALSAPAPDGPAGIPVQDSNSIPAMQ